ncbi:MAG: AAA family ATPase [Aulosira sp. ZfuVER01]|nr:AAA family ATPase [Aulosira sp. ZfuVER01]MDZ8002066.1 AAA family ATPase [Aulosira sp. DedVER01a]MDZ8056286.1 AAA family ATPase [Aulosira sp. ZfuCHP01]
MKSLTIDLPGYQSTNQLYAGSRTLVYQAIREADQYPVVLKLLREEYPSFGELVRFRNQYVIAQNLALKSVVKPLALLRYRQSYALVMEDAGGVSLANYLRADGDCPTPLGVTDFLIIGLQLAETLWELHRCRVIHKDLKPANILIQPETKQVKLIDFSISSLLPRETLEIQNPNVLEGTLAYLSPEQTGRMNRGIDYRSDFYSLGVTFYELLTGQLPFTTPDPVELVHCHIAKSPTPVAEINPTVPTVISDIVAKLMAKNAEDRYQSALGLKHDLERCQQQWDANADGIASFALGQQDICDRFLIPEKLYGRELEVQTLLAAFDRVSEGATELMLVAGFSGIGKTAVVNEVHKPIVRQRGYFIKGKYDQFGRNIPLSAFVQAFRDLVGQLLAETDAQLKTWKEKILSAVGENGQVILDVIPELEQIIGKQPPMPELSGSAAQNRFNLVFQNFTQVFTTKEHPLVIFLDDLQWADSASLQLLQLLMKDAGHLLVLGAYRDNEVSPTHSLMIAIAQMTKAKAAVNTMTLMPLSQDNVNQLIADTLNCEDAIAQPLTDLVYGKTKGNPFFTTQFLKALHEDGLIAFNLEAGCWQCDIAQVRSLALTDDVVQFMALQLQKLPPNTQNILKLAACVGNAFDLQTLAIVSQRSPEDVAVDLWKALQEGLVLPISEVYKFYQGEQTNAPAIGDRDRVAKYRFLHDRVQQAAYELIPDSKKQATHCEIGQLLLQGTPIAAREANSFEIARHLNIGASLIGDRTLLNQLAQLNLFAGRKAKKSTAYTTAIEHFSKGIALLATNTWQEQYETTLALHNEIVEVYLLTAQFNQVEQWAQVVLERAKTVLDTVKVYIARIQACIAQNNLSLAEQTALTILKHLNIQFPENPTDAEVQQSLTATQTRFACYNVEALVNLDEMTDPVYLAAMEILVTVVTASHQSVSPLFPLIVCKQIDLSLEYGNSPASASSYSWFGLIQASPSGNLDLCYQAGEVALRLIATRPNDGLKAKTMNITHAFVMHWKRHGRNELQPLLQTHQIGLETGELEHGAYALYNYTGISFAIGRNLSEMEQETETFDRVITELQQGTALCFLRIMRQAVLNLRGKAPDPCRLIGDAYDEAVMLPLHQANREQYAICSIYLNKLVLSYLFNDYQQAFENAMLAEQNSVALTAALKYTLIYFYSSLTQLAIYPTATPAQQAVILENVATNQAKIQQWAHYAPMTHAHKFDLIEAERYRVLGATYQAMVYYDRAIANAKENGYIQEESLANELAAKFYLDWGKEKVAAGYLQEAYYGYAHWGANAKIADLETRYPQLLQPILNQPQFSFNPLETLATFNHAASYSSTPVSSSNTNLGNALDFAAVLKAAQALSSSIQLEELIRSLTQMILVNAGAETCVLLLPYLDEWQIRAIAKLESGSFSPTTHLQTTTLENSTVVPMQLIQYVRRTQETLIVNGSKTDIPGAIGEYMLKHQPQSVLCTPILNQGKLVGVLYLEHRTTKGVFTRDRLLVTTFLCTQAAISLENARLYQESQTYAQQLENSLTQLQTSEARFQALTDNIPGMVYRFHLSPDGSTSTPYVSSGCYDLYEVAPESVMRGGDNLYRMNHPDDVLLVNQVISDSAQTLTPFKHEWRIITESGNIKWIQAVSRPQTQPNGSIVWDGVVIDISDRKRAEAAITQKSQELEQALQDLQKAQLQMIQTEKMSALGNLVAGVAHEINNPVGFISGNLKEAQQRLQELMEHLNLYRTQASDTEIADHAEEIDLDYLIEDLPKMMDSMKLGCDRIKSISTSLRTFSRADQNHQIAANLHEGIDSTILILKHRLKANELRPAIAVITDYGNIPAIECFPGQLNQVFMNILANAIDALDEANIGRSFLDIQANPNRITVKTSLCDTHQSVRISIQDNGIGMADDVREKIFDHLFTTKDVGKGTGLGLAIAKSIVVEKHSGAIEVNSTLGEGTEFVITLPVKAKR